MERWAQHFDAYERQVDGQPATFAIDLEAAAHAPVASHPLLVRLTLPMRAPGDDGQPSSSERAALATIEDELVELLETQADAIYVGNRVHGGVWELVFYLPPAHRDDVAALPARVAPGVEVRWTVTDDPAWAAHDALQPDAHVRQAIDNRRLIEHLSLDGDALAQPRAIDHLAYFPSEAAALAAAAALTALGFRCDDVDGDRDDSDDRECWALEFHRADALAGDHADRFTHAILDAIAPLDGHYDGWVPAVTLTE